MRMLAGAWTWALLALALARADSCQVGAPHGDASCPKDGPCSERGGACTQTFGGPSSCEGGSLAFGLCDGPAARRCCIGGCFVGAGHGEAGCKDQGCQEAGGKCVDARDGGASSCAGGELRSGLCGGPVPRRCCVGGAVPAKPSLTCGSFAGTCPPATARAAPETPCDGAGCQAVCCVAAKLAKCHDLVTGPVVCPEGTYMSAQDDKACAMPKGCAEDCCSTIFPPGVTVDGPRAAAFMTDVPPKPKRPPTLAGGAAAQRGSERSVVLVDLETKKEYTLTLTAAAEQRAATVSLEPTLPAAPNPKKLPEEGTLSPWMAEVGAAGFPQLGQPQVRVSDAAQFPFSAVGRLSKDLTDSCTASVVSDHLALTAAHCLFVPEVRKFSSDISFTAGENADKESPFKLLKPRLAVVSAPYLKYYRSPGAKTSNDWHSDWGMAVFRQVRSPGTGALGVRALSAADGPAAVRVVGYPVDQQSEAGFPQMTDTCSLTAGDKDLASKFQCEIAQGNSGGPLLDTKNNVVGVVFGAADQDKEQDNYAARLDEDMLTWIKVFKAHFG